MWNYNSKDLEEEIGVGSYLKQSGCYIAAIKEISEKITNGGAKQITFKFDVKGLEATVYHIYTKIDGTEIDFKVRHLNHLLFLTNSTKIKDISELKGKIVGVFLKAKLSPDKKYINFDIDGFFHEKTKQTSKEAKEGNKELKVYNKMKEMYENEKPLETIHEKSVQQQVSENKENSEVDFNTKEFPF